MICRIAIAVIGFVLVGGGDVSAESRVATKGRRVTNAFRYAVQASPSFALLIATLDGLERAVYVDDGDCLQDVQCRHLTAHPEGQRLLVRINVRQPRQHVVRQLAHELYHALEISRDASVIDTSTREAMYRRIGERVCRSGKPECWDTRASRAFEQLVMQELTEKEAVRQHGEKGTSQR